MASGKVKYVYYLIQAPMPLNKVSSLTLPYFDASIPKLNIEHILPRHLPSLAV